MAVLKTVQRGTATITTTGTLTDVTITSVDTAKAFVLFTTSAVTSVACNTNVAGTLTSGTNLRFTRGTTGSPLPSVTVTIDWFVVEFQSGVTVQRGNSTLTALTTNVTITAVTLAKAWPTIYQNNTGSGYNEDDYGTTNLTTTTNLAIVYTVIPTVEEGGWQVIEYDNASVQSVSISSWATATGNITITSTNSSKAALFISNTTPTPGPATNGCFTGRISTSTNVALERVGTTPTFGEVRVHVVEFADAWVQVQRVTTTSATSTATITAVDLNRSVVVTQATLHVGVHAGAASGTIQNVKERLSLTNTTTVSASRDGTLSVTWQSVVITWPYVFVDNEKPGPRKRTPRDAYNQWWVSSASSVPTLGAWFGVSAEYLSSRARAARAADGTWNLPAVSLPLDAYVAPEFAVVRSLARARAADGAWNLPAVSLPLDAYVAPELAVVRSLARARAADGAWNLPAVSLPLEAYVAPDVATARARARTLAADGSWNLSALLGVWFHDSAAAITRQIVYRERSNAIPWKGLIVPSCPPYEVLLEFLRSLADLSPDETSADASQILYTISGCSVPIQIKRNDRLPEVNATLRQSGSAFNLTGSTVKFIARNRATLAIKISADATIISATEGTVKYVWSALDTDTAGEYEAEFEVTQSDGRKITFPNGKYLEMVIYEDLA